MATPPEDELIAAVTTVRDAHADLGILRLWAQLKVEQPGWAVSEKRFRKALAAVGGTASGAGSTAAEGGSSSKKSKSKTKKNITADGPELVAKTGLDPSVDVQHIAPKVQAHMFGGTRGKGLVAKSGIEAGEWLWEETPWMACSDP
jgi:hypothetical protein